MRDQPDTLVDPAWRVGLAGLSLGVTVGLLGLLSALGLSNEVLYFGTWVVLAGTCTVWWLHQGRALLVRRYAERHLIVLACWLAWIVAAFVLGLLILS
jgi:hypothetical protein